MLDLPENATNAEGEETRGVAAMLSAARGVRRKRPMPASAQAAAADGLRRAEVVGAQLSASGPASRGLRDAALECILDCARRAPLGSTRRFPLHDDAGHCTG
jgi:hypothetical protein